MWWKKNKKLRSVWGADKNHLLIHGINEHVTVKVMASWNEDWISFWVGGGDGAADVDFVISYGKDGHCHFHSNRREFNGKEKQNQGQSVRKGSSSTNFNLLAGSEKES